MPKTNERGLRMAEYPEEGAQLLEGMKEKADEARKLLMGSLVLAREIHQEVLGKPEGADVVLALNEAEEVFIDTALTDELERLDCALDVIRKRAGAIFILMDYVSKEREKGF